MHRMATEVVDSQFKLKVEQNEVQTVRDRLPVVAREIKELEDEIEESLSLVGLVVDKAISPVGLNSLFGTIAELVADVSALENLDRDHVSAQDSLDDARRAFGTLRDKLLSDFAAAGIVILPARITTPADAVQIIKDWCARWDEQVGWRRDAGALENQIEAQLYLAGRVRELLALDPLERDRIARDTAEDVERIEAEGIELTRNIEGWRLDAQSLSTDSQIIDINARIAAIKANVEEKRVDAMRMRTQIALVESLAKKRAEESKPELVRRVQEMVLSVAEDWSSIEFDESGDVITIEKSSGESVPDSALSAGAKSLLYTAMRVAIMQQEADGETGFRIPLFCDDPLLHLDDNRTRQALRMLRDQSIGHQVIYFTCKNEIRDLAAELGVPVVAID